MGGLQVRGCCLVKVVRVHVQSAKVQLRTLVRVKVVDGPLEVGH